MKIINITFMSLFLFLIFNLLPITSSLKIKPQRCHPDDQKVLLQIKTHFHNSSLFSTWSSHTDCCKWRIVLCKKLPKTTIYRVNFLEIDGADDLIGTIPPLIADLPYLETLIFRNLPNLTGPIPPAIAKLTHLRFLLLNWNSLTGPIPPYFSRLNNLATLGLNNNRFTGPIPPYLGQLPNLLGVDLSNNQLTGPIPPTFGSFGLGAQVQLSNNLLSGPIPKSLGRVNFSTFEAAGNRLTGDASFLFGKDKTELGHLDLSRNRLVFDFGKVVMPVGELDSSLSVLELSHNMIYGRLPTWLGNVRGLFQFNVSYNRLCGPIEGKLQEFDQSSFEHNLCLCGSPLPPYLLPLSTSNHDDLSLEGVATNVKLLLKLVQDHQDASHKGTIDERKVQRFAGMMTILDDVKTRLQKSQTSDKKSRAELRRCNTDLKINHPPRDDTKKGVVELVLDEKERLRKDLNTSFAAQKRLGAMCASLGREKEIISKELTRKVQELNEMEQLVNDLRAQNERLSEKIRALVAHEKENTRFINGTELQQLSSTYLNERNKELSDQLLKSLKGYKMMKRRLKETQEENEGIQSIMEELGDEIQVGIQQIYNLKDHISSGDYREEVGKIEENITALDLVFYKLKQRVSKHKKGGMQ